MANHSLGIPVFDADNHLYETQVALTKFLPDRDVRKIMGANLARLMNLGDPVAG